MNGVQNLWGRICGVLLMLIGSATLIAALLQPNNDNLFLTYTKLSSQEVLQGGSIKGQVSLVNLSSSPVTVKAMPSCGCTVITAPTGKLMPFHKITLPIVIFTDGFPKGKSEKSIGFQFTTATDTAERDALFKFVVK